MRLEHLNILNLQTDLLKPEEKQTMELDPMTVPEVREMIEVIVVRLRKEIESCRNFRAVMEAADKILTEANNEFRATLKLPLILPDCEHVLLSVNLEILNDPDRNNVAFKLMLEIANCEKPTVQ